MFFRKKKPETLETELGLATVENGNLVLKSWRHRGLIIDISWPQDTPVPVALVHEIQDNFPGYWDKALDRLEIAQFPTHLKAVIPEWIDFETDQGDWVLNFCCPEWPDAIWGVIFKGGEAVADFHGD